MVTIIMGNRLLRKQTLLNQFKREKFRFLKLLKKKLKLLKPILRENTQNSSKKRKKREKTGSFSRSKWIK